MQHQRPLGARIWRRMRDIPWKVSRIRQSILRSEFWELYRLVTPYTMVEYRRLEGLYLGVRRVVRNGIPGDIVECGAARGGSAALMGIVLKRMRSEKKLWLFDTFSGLPAPTSADPDYEIARKFTGTCVGELHEVKALFEQFQILEGVNFVKGLFQATLPGAGVREIAFLHIDGDWYESVKACLECLYHRVSPGGIIQIDDYEHWAGARKAVDEFMQKSAPGARLRYLDYTGRQIVKPSQATHS